MTQSIAFRVKMVLLNCYDKQHEADTSQVSASLSLIRRIAFFVGVWYSGNGVGISPTKFLKSWNFESHQIIKRKRLRYMSDQFREVFARTPLPDWLKNAFWQAVVKEISYSKSKNKVAMSMLFMEENQAVLVSELSKEFNKLYGMEFEVAYTVDVPIAAPTMAESATGQEQMSFQQTVQGQASSALLPQSSASGSIVSVPMPTAPISGQVSSSQPPMVPPVIGSFSPGQAGQSGQAAQGGFKRGGQGNGDFKYSKGGGRRKTKIVEEIKGERSDLGAELVRDTEVILEGSVVSFESRETKSAQIIVSFDFTNLKSSVTVKFFTKPEDLKTFKDLIAPRKNLCVKGRVQFDEFSKELNVMADELCPGEPPLMRKDEAPEKRVELHLHTQMSSMDGITNVKEYIKRAAAWGHKAIAITDHGVVQSFPDAGDEAKKQKIKVIYGVEAYLIDDMKEADEEDTGGGSGEDSKVKSKDTASPIGTKKLRYYHAIILAKNKKGLRNLYELVSKAHIDYFYKRPRIPKSEFVRLREGLIIGTACEAGEFYLAVRMNKPESEIHRLAEFYDYFEIQPIENNMYLVREGHLPSQGALIDINKKIVELGKLYNKPVVATCDVHFIDPGDEVFRRIIMAGEGFKDADMQAPLYFRTTDEMLKEFAYLGDEAYDVVIKNTNLIADMIESFKPIPDETFPPKIEGAEELIEKITMDRAKELYEHEGKLPELIQERLDKELNSIIKNGFSVMYIIAQKLVSKSMEDGYLVGSRGSVGSSFVATMAGITEVNPLPPHYRCPNCRYTDFDSELVKSYSGGSGCDMPDQPCPKCGTVMEKDGHEIPFETFLGFDGDKEPDIDLNFSGEYQAKAHAYTEELFGEGNVFKAGTIGTLADKTAYGFVKKYMEERGMAPSGAEVNRLKIGCTGIKRTTGQHPGGLMIVPSDCSIYDFTPVQRPANDQSSNVTTTHFDYHSISGRLLKLDILGHDVPTMIRMLADDTGVDPIKIPLGDKKVISLFTSPEALSVTEEDINCKTGSLGLPEFGTNFVRQMLLDTKPESFSDLVRISGLSHGTEVWVNNQQDLVRNGVATLKEIIPTRDDIMVYLIHMGVEKKAAFKIMENVRKGKGLTPEEEDVMSEAGVPDWYINACKKISYMFPKGHAVAYVMMTVRIGYFKIYHPYSFYAATFSVKTDDFDYEMMCHGKELAKKHIERINNLGKDASAKDKNLLTTLELVLEMYMRGLRFVPIDLYTAEERRFIVTKEGLMPPLCTLQGLGASVAQKIIEERKKGKFETIDDLIRRTKANKNVIELLKNNKIIDDMPENDQLTLF